MSDQNKLNIHPKKVSKIINRFIADGPSVLHVLTDFDRTLTKNYINNQKAPSLIALLRDGNYLTKDYINHAHKLYAKYHPYEVDPKLSQKERQRWMYKWWQEHLELLLKFGLTIQDLQHCIHQSQIEFRTGANEFFNITKKNQIPVIIMSSSLGDLINQALEDHNYKSGNVHIISNYFKFNQRGKAISIKLPIITVSNKYDVILNQLPTHQVIKDRTNVILMGDHLDDTGMIEGFNYANLLKIGFLNENVQKQKLIYQQNFDILISNDGSLEPVNDLLKEITKSK